MPTLIPLNIEKHNNSESNENSKGSGGGELLLIYRHEYSNN